MTWQSKGASSRTRRDEIELVALTASGEGEIPAGEVYFAGTDWRSGDLICVRGDEDGNVRVERRSRFGGFLMHEPVPLQKAVAAAAWFDASGPDEDVTRWKGSGWEFVIDGGRGVLRRAQEGTL